MRTPSRYYEYKSGLGEEYNRKLRLTVGSLRKLEESTGKKWEEVLDQIDEDPVGGFIDIMWAASLPFNPETTKEEMEHFYDLLIDDEYDQFDINGMLMHVMQKSGLSDNSIDVDEVIEDMRTQSRERSAEMAAEGNVPKQED